MASRIPDDRSPAALEARLAASARHALGREVVRSEPLAPGLGTRRFRRLRLAGDATPRSVVARISAPEDPAGRPVGTAPEPPLEPIRSLLEDHGLPVPASYRPTGDPEIELLEDVGDRCLLDLAPDVREAAYREACGWIPRLQALAPAPGVEAFERRLDARLLAYKAEQIEQWLVPWALERPAGEDERAVLRVAFAEIEAAVAAAPRRLAHRDYKAANLHLHPEDGHVVWIDLQGAFLAPPEYDLVCLLRDLQVRLDDAEIEGHLAATCRRLPDAGDLAEHRERFDLLTVSRVGKDLSRYRYATVERGDPRYARHYGTGLHHLGQALAALAPGRPAFAAMGEWIARLAEREGP